MTNELFPPTDTGMCNTHAGYNRHARINQWACEGCMKAHAEYTRASHIVRRPSATVRIDLDILRKWLDNPASVLADHLPDIMVHAIRYGRMPTQKDMT